MLFALLGAGGGVTGERSSENTGLKVPVAFKGSFPRVSLKCTVFLNHSVAQQCLESATWCFSPHLYGPKAALILTSPLRHTQARSAVDHFMLRLPFPEMLMPPRELQAPIIRSCPVTQWSRRGREHTRRSSIVSLASKTNEACSDAPGKD